VPQLIRVSNTDGVEIKQIGASAVCARSLEKAVNVHGWVYTNTLSSMCKDTCVCVRECDTYRQTTF